MTGTDAEKDTFDLFTDSFDVLDFCLRLFVELLLLVIGQRVILVAFGGGGGGGTLGGTLCGVPFFLGGAMPAMPLRAFVSSPMSSLSRAIIEGRLLMVRRACCRSKVSPTTSIGYRW